MEKALHKIAPPEHFDDFKQEVFLILTEKKDDVLRAYKDGKHLFYAVRIMLNLANQERNVYIRNYRQGNVQFEDYQKPCEDSGELEIRKIKEEDEIKIIDRIKNLEQTTGTCYYRLLVAAIEKHGSYREVSRQTGIPLTSIHNAVKKIRKIISDD